MELRKTDPEFYERFDAFAFDEVANDETAKLPMETRYLAILAALIGCGGTDGYRELLARALDDGFPAVKARESCYQATDYLGYGRMLPFLKAMNEVFAEKRISGLPSGTTTTVEDRLEKGIEAQADIFGEQMKEAWKAGTVNRWLADNCFGDFYTRKGLTLAERELITFCFLAAQGGCEPQLTAHAGGNMNVGNDQALLLRVVLQCVPYIGYPRSLNAIACVNKAAESRK